VTIGILVRDVDGPRSRVEIGERAVRAELALPPAATGEGGADGSGDAAAAPRTATLALEA
jgi:hypothetical protein